MRSEQEPLETPEKAPSDMTNEERMKVYSKKLFANREYLGYLVYRNPPKTTDKAMSNPKPQQQPPQVSGLVNPIASTIGSKIFGKPDRDQLESDSCKG